MSKSCDILLDNDYTIHISILPALGLIMVNELKDFGENWLEIKVVQNSKYRLFYDIRTLVGDGKQQEVCRYFVDSIHNRLHKKAGQSPEQIGSVLKFMINLSLRPEIMGNRCHINSLANALVNLLEDFLQAPSPRLLLGGSS